MYIVFGLGVFQSFVFSILLISKEEKEQADKFLAAFFFVIALYLLNIFSINFGIWKQYPNVLFIYSLIYLSYGPLLFFYVSSLIGKRITVKKILMHCIPIIVVLLWPALKNMGGGSDDGGMLGDLMGKATDPLADFASKLFTNINDFSWGGFIFLIGLQVAIF